MSEHCADAKFPCEISLHPLLASPLRHTCVSILVVKIAMLSSTGASAVILTGTPDRDREQHLKGAETSFFSACHLKYHAEL